MCIPILEAAWSGQNGGSSKYVCVCVCVCVCERLFMISLKCSKECLEKNKVQDLF